jgi:hypothetical protein
MPETSQPVFSFGESEAKRGRQPRATSDSGATPDRVPSRLAARRSTPMDSGNQSVRESSLPLRAGTARGPIQRLMQP